MNLDFLSYQSATILMADALPYTPHELTQIYFKGTVLMFHIREVLGSNLGPDTGSLLIDDFHDFPQTQTSLLCAKTGNCQ
jgi:hypothetical protein